MKQDKLLGLFFLVFLLCISCKKEAVNLDTKESATSDTEESANPEALEGTWFRSFTNKVWGGHNQPVIERGESHIRISFNNQGEYVKDITVLGLYEGTNSTDTSAIIIEAGTYTTEQEKINILINGHKWWDAFYEDMDSFEQSGFNPNKYIDMTYKITNEELNLVYFIETDVITEEQETPGLDKFEVAFSKE